MAYSAEETAPVAQLDKKNSYYSNTNLPHIMNITVGK